MDKMRERERELDGGRESYDRKRQKGMGERNERGVTEGREGKGGEERRREEEIGDDV